MDEKIGMAKKWTINRYETQEDFLDGKIADFVIDGTGKELPGISEFKGNVLLNEGIAILLTLLAGTGGTAYSNANAYLGVGESTTAAAATDTGLIGATLEYQPMEATYPTIAAQAITFRAIFATDEANNAWQEFTVVNASTDAGDNLNRKVSDQGTKTAGQVWTLDLEITFS